MPRASKAPKPDPNALYVAWKSFASAKTEGVTRRGDRLRGDHPAVVSHPRRLRALAGEGLVTPTRPIAVIYEGRREVLEPGKSRLAPHHPLVRRCGPEKFQLCCPRDDRTDAPMVFRRMLERARGELEAELDGWRLPSYEPPTGRERWRLR
jgi:hypothetical protein